MKLIKPSEISARILTLLDESDERVIIVSPYMKISKWYKFMNKLNGLKTRSIHTEIYVRDDPDNMATYRDLDQLALPYKKIPHLHSKLYLNKRYGIVTSMNLLLSSEINSLEIGYTTETWKEYNDLLGFYYRYIHIGEPVHCETITNQPTVDLKEIVQRIRKELERTGKNPWIWLTKNALHICTGGNNYIVSICDGYLRVTARLRITSKIKLKGVQHTSLMANELLAGKVGDFNELISKNVWNLNALIQKKVGDLTAMRIDLHPGPGPYDLQLSGQAQQTLKCSSISGILDPEARYMMASVVNFIEATDALEL